jgi:hypothetical protein
MKVIPDNRMPSGTRRRRLKQVGDRTSSTDQQDLYWQRRRQPA